MTAVRRPAAAPGGGPFGALAARHPRAVPRIPNHRLNLSGEGHPPGRDRGWTPTRATRSIHPQPHRHPHQGKRVRALWRQTDPDRPQLDLGQQRPRQRLRACPGARLHPEQQHQAALGAPHPNPPLGHITGTVRDTTLHIPTIGILRLAPTRRTRRPGVGGRTRIDIVYVALSTPAAGTPSPSRAQPRVPTWRESSPPLDRSEPRATSWPALALDCLHPEDPKCLFA